MKYTSTRFRVLGLWPNADIKHLKNWITSITQFYFDLDPVFVKNKKHPLFTVISFRVQITNSKDIYFLRDALELELQPSQISVIRVH